MKYLFFLLLIFGATGWLPAQFLPFQGKVFDADDQPLSGQHTFQFSIADGGVNWTETHPAVTVYQGIYAVVLGSQTPLPDGVFANSAMHTLQVQMDGAPLADVMLYRPIENDPKLPDELRDGAQWEDISNPPNLVPIGTILSYGGRRTTLPAGWLVCDGQTLSRTEYPELFNALGVAWGSGDGISTFHLPDLRGQFLRGVSTDSSQDPNFTARTRINNGFSAEGVGSFQEDALGRHDHNQAGYGLIRRSIKDEERTPNGFDDINSGDEPDVKTNTSKMPDAGGTETRPKNAAVYYIIKVR